MSYLTSYSIQYMLKIFNHCSDALKVHYQVSYNEDIFEHSVIPLIHQVHQLVIAMYCTFVDHNH